MFVYNNGTNVVEATSGDIFGPASSTDNAVARFDGTTGKAIQNSVVTIADSTGDMAGVGTLSSGAITTTGVLTLPAGTVSAPAITTTGDTNTGIFFPAADTIAFTEGGVESMRIDSSGNVGIGTSSPSVKLEVSGRVLGDSLVAANAVYIWSQNRMSLGASYGIESQQNSPLFMLTQGVAQPIVFGTNSTERMRIDSSGNVGIGTSTPSSYAFGLAIDNTNATNTGYVFNLLSSGSSWFKVGRLAASSTAIIQSGQDLSLQPDSGNVGIGTSSPATKVEISGTAAAQNLALRITNTATDGYSALQLGGGGDAGLARNGSAQSAYAGANSINLFTVGAHNIGFTTQNTLRAIIDSSGNVGIGTSSPNGKVDIVSSSAGANTNTLFLTNSSGTAGTATSLVFGVGSDPTNRQAVIRGINAGGNAINLAFLTSDADAPAERMRIDSSGKVLIGTTSSPSAPGALLTLSGSGAAYTQWNKATDGGGVIGAEGSGLWFYTYTGSIGSETYTERMRINSSGALLVGTTTVYNTATTNVGFVGNVGSGISINSTTNTNGATYEVFLTTGTLIGSISNNNNTGVLYNVTSDYRLKNNAVALTGAKDFVMALKPKAWDWYNDLGKGVGFLAHEFMEVAKYSGFGEKDAVDSDGKPIYQTIQASSTEVMANIVALIQEQQALIENLTTRLNALEGN